jgi:hypothetical protein
MGNCPISANELHNRFDISKSGQFGKAPARMAFHEKTVALQGNLRKNVGIMPNQCSWFHLWADDNIALIETYRPTGGSETRSAGLAGARLICAAGAFVGPALGISLTP